MTTSPDDRGPSLHCYRIWLPIALLSLALTVVGCGSRERKNKRQNQEELLKPPGRRVVTFPKGEPFGEVAVVDWNKAETASIADSDMIEALGKIVIPAGKTLFLGTMSSSKPDSKRRPLNLSPLDSLGPKDVQGIHIAFTEVTPKELRRLNRFPALRELSFTLCDFDDECLLPIGRLSQLRVLELPEGRLTSSGTKHLRKLTNLEKLDLYGTAIQDSAVKHLSGLTKLRDLRLGNTQVTDAGLQYLQKLTNLEHLQLLNTHITDIGLIQIGRFTKLKRLNLLGTHVTDKGLSHLRGLKKLEWLELRSTRVSDKGRKKIKQMLPNLKYVGDE